MTPILINFDELYKYDRIGEHCQVAVPFPKGEVCDLSKLTLLDGNVALPLQSKSTATWDDGSIKWGFFRFITDLKRCSRKTLTLTEGEPCTNHDSIVINHSGDGFAVDTGAISFAVGTGDGIFSSITYNNDVLTQKHLPGIYLTDTSENVYKCRTDFWEIKEQGNLVVCLLGRGRHMCNGMPDIAFEIEITAFLNKDYFDIGYRLINTTDAPLHIKDISFDIKFTKNRHSMFQTPPKKVDSTGCGDGIIPLAPQTGPVFNTMGTLFMDELNEKLNYGSTRVCVGTSNYRTEFFARNDGNGIYQLMDSNYILKEANEHYHEVFYGTFFVDRCDSNYGICATVFKAQQNYPKAVYADDSKLTVFIVPDCDDRVVMQSGMARTQHFMLHFHDKDASLTELDNRSLIYQLPDRPYISENVYRDAKVCLDVFVENKMPVAEWELINRGDNRSRAFGMMNYGDAPDPGYTKQGRGNGEPVWTNNEYDFPHAAALMYMRSGIRRFMDYMMVAAEHWMDVDVCHYSTNPLLQDGQWEHTNGHCKNGQIVCSHEWVEGLLDYYHFTGDKRAYDTAIGIGMNVLRLLDTPIFANKGEINARETGWALRTLVALYSETNDPGWLTKCAWIVGHFRDWEAEYGHWLSPYTDNTAIRVPFMISIAACSLMRYYRICQDEEVKGMILRAVDDIVENSILDTGVFYYKQLPSLERLGGNTLVLEALATAYELTQDIMYLRKGLPTFKAALGSTSGSGVSGKTQVNDAVITAGPGPKGFAQSFIPLAVFYKAVMETGLDKEL